MKFIWTEDTGAGLQKYWSVKGDRMGDCWYKDCCVMDNNEGKCLIADMTGESKIKTLLADVETQRLIKAI